MKAGQARVAFFLHSIKMTFGKKKKKVSLLRKSLGGLKIHEADALKYQFRGHRPNTAVIFHLQNIFQLIVYQDVLPAKLHSQGEFLFSVYRAETWMRLYISAFSLTNNRKPLPEPGWFWNRTPDKSQRLPL